MSVIIGGIGKILAFFSSGGNRATLLNLPEEIPAVYNPKIVWLPDDENTGRTMEEFNRDVLSSNYIRALYQRNLSLSNIQKEGFK